VVMPSVIYRHTYDDEASIIFVSQTIIEVRFVTTRPMFHLARFDLYSYLSVCVVRQHIYRISHRTFRGFVQRMCRQYRLKKVIRHCLLTMLCRARTYLCCGASLPHLADFHHGASVYVLRVLCEQHCYQKPVAIKDVSRS